MNVENYIKLINNSSDDIALEAWDEACRAYENDPKEEWGLIEIHKACASKLVDIINRKFKEEDDERTTFESSAS